MGKIRQPEGSVCAWKCWAISECSVSSVAPFSVSHIGQGYFSVNNRTWMRGFCGKKGVRREKRRAKGKHQRAREGSFEKHLWSGFRRHHNALSTDFHLHLPWFFFLSPHPECDLHFAAKVLKMFRLLTVDIAMTTPANNIDWPTSSKDQMGKSWGVVAPLKVDGFFLLDNGSAILGSYGQPLLGRGGAAGQHWCPTVVF